MDKMVANSKYKIYNSEGNNSELADLKHSLGFSHITHASFTIQGKPDFDGLNLKEYGWVRTFALTPQQKKALENDPNYVDFKEIMKYEGPQGNAVLHLNYKTDKHRIKLTYIEDPENKPATVKLLKTMFELELGFPLIKKTSKNKSSDLIDKFNLNSN